MAHNTYLFLKGMKTIVIWIPQLFLFHFLSLSLSLPPCVYEWYLKIVMLDREKGNAKSVQAAMFLQLKSSLKFSSALFLSNAHFNNLYDICISHSCIDLPNGIFSVGIWPRTILNPVSNMMAHSINVFVFILCVFILDNVDVAAVIIVWLWCATCTHFPLFKAIISLFQRIILYALLYSRLFV